MRIFEDDDAGYLAWVESHQHGFVVNTFRRPDPRDLMLHRATCGTITGKPAPGDRWTTGLFLKACSETRAAFDQWARQIAGGGGVHGAPPPDHGPVGPYLQYWAA